MKIDFMPQGKEVKKDLAFLSKNTELFALWTAYYMIVAGLFFFLVNKTVSFMTILFIIPLFMVAFAMCLGLVFFSIATLNNKKYVKVHTALNRSFKVRSLFGFIKLPSLSSLISDFSKNIKQGRSHIKLAS